MQHIEPFVQSAEYRVSLFLGLLTTQSVFGAKVSKFSLCLWLEDMTQWRNCYSGTRENIWLSITFFKIGISICLFHVSMFFMTYIVLHIDMYVLWWWSIAGISILLLRHCCSSSCAYNDTTLRSDSLESHLVSCCSQVNEETFCNNYWLSLQTVVQITV